MGCVFANENHVGGLKNLVGFALSTAKRVGVLQKRVGSFLTIAMRAVILQKPMGTVFNTAKRAGVLQKLVGSVSAPQNVQEHYVCTWCPFLPPQNVKEGKTWLVSFLSPRNV